jgi:catechol 2,3-dioxygenase-like lactoylglutathione lyase family enzyme
MKVSAIRSCSVGVSDLAMAEALFSGVMGLNAEARGSLAEDHARALHLPHVVRTQFLELSAGGYPVGRLRLLQHDPPAREFVRLDHAGADSPTDVGPKAIDFYVANPIAPRIREIERAGYRFRSPPVRHVIGDTESEECLFSGPDGVPVLIMVGHRHSDAEQRPGCLANGPYSEIATISVVSGDLSASREFYEGVLGMKALVDAETGSDHRNRVNTLTGVPDETRIQFRLYAEHGEASGKILLVHFYERTGRRLTDRMRPSRLGFSLLTHETDDLAALHRALLDAGHAVLTPPTRVGGWPGERLVMLAKGPNEELFEFYQAC